MALKFAIAFTLTMTIVVMHYTGMAAMSFIPVNPARM
jgi:NO-binding membrane sensor protein with MHYT domain